MELHFRSPIRFQGVHNNNLIQSGTACSYSLTNLNVGHGSQERHVGYCADVFKRLTPNFDTTHMANYIRFATITKSSLHNLPVNIYDMDTFNKAASQLMSMQCATASTHTFRVSICIMPRLWSGHLDHLTLTLAIFGSGFGVWWSQTRTWQSSMTSILREGKKIIAAIQRTVNHVCVRACVQQTIYAENMY